MKQGASRKMCADLFGDLHTPIVSSLVELNRERGESDLKGS